MSKSNRKKGNIWALLGKKGNIFGKKRAIFFLRISFYISELRESNTKKRAIFNCQKGQYSRTSLGQYLRKTLISI